MPDFLKTIGEQVKKIYQDLGLAQRLAIGVLLGIILVSSFWLIFQAKTPTMLPLLYEGTDPSMMGQVMKSLDEMKVPYEIRENRIYVPVSERDKLLFKLYAGGGLPKGPNLYKWVFDTDFSETRAKEDLRLQVTLRQRLEQMLESLDGVNTATVEFRAVPDTPFILGPQEQAKASVLLKLNPNKKLSKETVLGIAQIVAFAIPGLDPKNVTILDTNRNLYPVPDEQSELYISQQEMEEKVKYEMMCEQKVKELMSFFSFVSAKASVTLDRSSLYEEHKGTDPQQIAPIDIKKEQTQVQKQEAQGTPGVISNLPATSIPPSPSSGTPSTLSLKEETQNSVGEKDIITRHPAGDIKSLTLSIVLPYEEVLKYIGEPPETGGKKTSAMQFTNNLDSLKELAAKGCGTTQGNIQITTVHFQPPSPPVPPSRVEQIRDFIALYSSDIVFLLVIGVCLIVVYRITRSPSAKVLQTKLDQLKQELTAKQGVQPLPGMAGAPLPEGVADRGQTLQNQARDMAKKDPQKAAQIIQQWVRKET